MQQYEIFKMRSNKTIAQMFVSKSFTSIKLVINKILKSLLKAYQRKIVAIWEAKDLSKFPFEELMGPLMTYEIMMKDHDKDEEKDKKKKESMALKSFTQDEDKEDKEIGDIELEQVALLSKKYMKYLRLKKESNSNPNFKSNDHTKNKSTMRRKSTKKAMKATQDGSRESESKNEDQERTSNMCLMPIDDEVKSLELNDESSDDEFDDELDDLSYEEL